MEELKNRFLVIKNQINGVPQESDFEIKTEPISLSPSDITKKLIVKNLYVTVDPVQLVRMKGAAYSHVTIPVIPGHIIDTYGVGRVVASGRPEFAEGDLVVGVLTWAEYTVAEEGRDLNKLDTLGFPLTYHLGPLGFSGIAAYGGFYEVCKPKKGENVFVSAASGSIGHLVGQYAKLFGCRVIGSAGTKQKVDLLKEKLGFDDAFNYKDEKDLKSCLKRYFPDGIDIYFDNVGGEMLEAVVANMNVHGRVAVCGAISEYTGEGRRGAPDMLNVVYKRITIQGFYGVLDFTKSYADFISTTAEHLHAGRMEAVFDISHGLDSVPFAFVSLFRGDNVGKKIVQISSE